MFYAKFTDQEGCYMDADGVRFSISSARRVRSPQGVNVGYEEFPSLDDALGAWGLTPVAWFFSIISSPP